MKKVLLIFLFSISLFANSWIEGKRQSDINKYVDSLQNISNKIEKEIIKNATLSITKEMLNNSYPGQLTDDDFKNYAKTTDLFFVISKEKVSITNAFSETNQFIKDDAINSAVLLPTVKINGDSFDYFFEDKVKNIIDTKEDVDTNPNKEWINGSNNLPSIGNPNKLYYVLNEDGSIDIYKWDEETNSWKKISSINSSNATSNECLFNINSYEELIKIIGTEPQCARIDVDGIMTVYWWSEKSKKWIMEGGANAKKKLLGETANNIGDLLDRNPDNKWFNAEVGSDVDINGLLGTSVNMKRMLNYWKTSSLVSIVTYDNSLQQRNIYVAEKLSDLPNSALEGSVAYLKENNDNRGFMGDNSRYEAVFYQYRWYPIVPDLYNLVMTANPIISNEYFELFTKSVYNYNATYWKEDKINNPIHITKGGRNELPIANNNSINLTLSIGTENNNGGVKSIYPSINGEYFYIWYFTDTGGYRNMIDAITRTSLYQVYENQDPAAIVNNVVYLKKIDNKNRIIYQNINDNTFWTKNSQQIPAIYIENNLVNLPEFKSAEIVNFSGESIIIDNYKQITDWNDAPLNASVIYSSKKYTHILRNGLDFWTDNITGDGQQYATNIFSKGSRKSVPTITHSSVKVYTRQLCLDNPYCLKNNGLENRYTDNGIIASIDSSYKEWFYSLTGSNLVSNLLDNPCLNKSLTADYSNSTCYKQTNTIINNYFQWLNVGSIYYGIYEFWEGNNECPYKENNDQRPDFIGLPNQTYTNGGATSFICNLKYKTYTCPSSHPNKLNNSICEFREPF